MHMQVHSPVGTVDQGARATLLRQKPALVWLTGLSGAGKSTIAGLLAGRLHALGRATYVLDGDHLRQGLCRDLGFSDGDRSENIRRAAEVARLMTDAGLIVIAAFISPFRKDRALVRSMLAPGEFIEVFVDAPLPVAEARDPKGLYARARRGELPRFTGVDAPYEAPESPELSLDTSSLTADQAVDRVLEVVLARVSR